MTDSELLEALGRLDDPELDAFAMDYFWDIYKDHFGRGMSPIEKKQAIIRICTKTGRLSELEQMLTRVLSGKGYYR